MQVGDGTMTAILIMYLIAIVVLGVYSLDREDAPPDDQDWD